MSVPSKPSNKSAVIPPIIISANQNKNRAPPITADPANIISMPVGAESPNKSNISSSISAINPC